MALSVLALWLRFSGTSEALSMQAPLSTTRVGIASPVARAACTGGAPNRKYHPAQKRCSKRYSADECYATGVARLRQSVKDSCDLLKWIPSTYGVYSVDLWRPFLYRNSTTTSE